MDVLNNLGVNWVLLVAQIVNFLVVFYILKRFLYKPILELLKNREKTIQESQKQAEETKQLLERTAKKEKEVIKKAQEEARKLLEDARKQRDEIIAQSQTAAKEQAKVILEEARAQIGEETKAAEKRLAAQISTLAVQFLEKSADELFGKEEKEAVMKNALKKIGKKVD